MPSALGATTRAPSRPTSTLGRHAVAPDRTAGPAATTATSLGAPAQTSAPQGRPPETTSREAAAALLLITRGTQPPAAYAQLIEGQGSAHAVLLRERLAAAPQTSLFSDPEAELETELAAIEADIREWRHQGMQLLTVLDGRYPDNLSAVPERPALLFVAGRLKPRDARGVAVVGCPEADRSQLRAAEELARGLAAAGHTVISGLAEGVDTAAHLAALKRGGRTIAAIATGVSLCYPRTNVILQRRIAAECAVVSPFVPDTAPSAATFAARVPVLVGMALATVIVAASPTGSTRAHAHEAIAQRRPLVLFESLLRHKWAREVGELPGVAVAATPADALHAVHTMIAP